MTFSTEIGSGEILSLYRGETFCVNKIRTQSVSNSTVWPPQQEEVPEGLFYLVEDWNAEILSCRLIAVAKVFEQVGYQFLSCEDMHQANEIANFTGDFDVCALNSCSPIFLGGVRARFLRQSYSLVERMTVEELLTSPYRWLREWPFKNEENRILYGVEDSQ